MDSITDRNDSSDDEDPDGDDSRNPFQSLPTKRVAIWGVGLSFLVLLMYLFAPTVNTLLYTVPSTVPATIVYGILVPVLIAGYIRYGGELTTRQRRAFAAAIVIVALLGVVAHPLSQEAKMQALNDRLDERTQTVDSMPNTSTDSARLNTYNVCRKYAENVVSKPQYKVSDQQDITWIDGDPYCSFGLTADTTAQYLGGQQNGSVYVNMTTSDPDATIVEGDVKKGMGVVPWNSHSHASVLNRPLVDYRDPFVIPDRLPEQDVGKGKTRIATPSVTHEWRLKYGFVPYTVPKFHGASVVHPNGTATYYTKAELQKKYPDQNWMPYSLSRKMVMSETWEKGIYNRYISQQNVFQFSEPQTDYENRLPYTQAMEGGWIGYHMPTGGQGGGNAIYRYYIGDGGFGNYYKVYNPGEQEKFIGLRDTNGFVKKADVPDSITNWNDFELQEPLPVTPAGRGQTYYMFRITPVSSQGINSYAFLNASNTSNVRFARNDQQARAFLATGRMPSDGGGETEVRYVGGDSYDLVVRKNGEVVGRYEVSQSLTVGYERTGNQTVNKTATPGN